MNKKGIIIGATVVILIILVVVFNSNSNSDDIGPINIGVSAPLTGPVATFGQWAVNGMNLAVEEINNSGGIDGRKIQLTIEDDKCSPKDGNTTVNKLIELDGNKVVIVFCGSVTSAVVGNLEDDKVLMYNVSIRTQDLLNKYPFLFNMSPSAEKESLKLVSHAYENGSRKAAIL